MTVAPGSHSGHVDAAIAALSGLDQLPLTEHVAAIERAYAALTETLDEAQ